MTIPFKKLKARLLANPKVKAEYDALAPEFEIAGRADEDQPVRDRATRKRSNAPEHKDAFALRRGDRQQIPRPAVGGLMALIRNTAPPARMQALHFVMGLFGG